MKQAELVGALSHYASRNKGTMKGQDTLAFFLASYFDKLDNPVDQKWDFVDIDPNIPQLLLGALEEFRTSEDETVRQFRAIYEEELDRPFFDPTDIWGSGLAQALTIQSLGDLFGDVTGADWIAGQIYAVFNAERQLLQLVFFKYLNRVLRRGLFEIIDSSPKRGMSGTFGETTLRSYVLAGRLMLTFARPGEKMEHSASFICEDDDPLGLGGGIQSVYTDLQTAIAMINDVVTGWPEDRSAQADIFKADEDVSLG